MARGEGASSGEGDSDPRSIGLSPILDPEFQLTVSDFLERTCAAGVTNPDLGSRIPMYSDDRQFRRITREIEIDGDPDLLAEWSELAAGFEPKGLMHSGPGANLSHMMPPGAPEVLLEWAAQGVVGTFAWHLLTKSQSVIRNRVSPRAASQRPFSSDEALEFAHLYFEGRYGELADPSLILVGKSDRTRSVRTGRRTWTPTTRWRFVALSRTTRYVITLESDDRSEIPVLVGIQESASSDEIYQSFAG